MADLRLPIQIRVLGQPYRVDFVTRDDGLFRGVSGDAVGATDLTRQIIKLRGPEDMSPHQAVDTLLHETLHAMFYVFGFERFLKDAHDEGLVDVLAPALMHTLRDNPDLVDAIMSNLDTPRHGEEFTDLRHQHTHEEASDGHPD